MPQYPRAAVDKSIRTRSFCCAIVRTFSRLIRVRLVRLEGVRRPAVDRSLTDCLRGLLGHGGRERPFDLATVCGHHVVGLAHLANPAVVEPDDSLANRGDRTQIVADHHHQPRVVDQLSHPPAGLHLEGEVAGVSTSSMIRISGAIVVAIENASRTIMPAE